MNNFEERIAELKNYESNDVHSRQSRIALLDLLVRDLYAALQAKDAEIAELKHDVAEQLKIIATQHDEVAELRGLMKEEKTNNRFLLGEFANLKCAISNIIEVAHETTSSITTALAGKEQPK